MPSEICRRHFFLLILQHHHEKLRNSFSIFATFHNSLPGQEC
jgi:hypothetical protein